MIHIEPTGGTRRCNKCEKLDARASLLFKKLAGLLFMPVEGKWCRAGREAHIEPTGGTRPLNLSRNCAVAMGARCPEVITQKWSLRR